MAKNKKLQNVAVLAIFLFVATMAIGDFGGLFSIYSYGGKTAFYVGDNIDFTGSRSTAELTAICNGDAYHMLSIYSTNVVPNKLVVQEIKTIGKIVLVNNKYMFANGGTSTAYTYAFKAGEARLPIGSYVAKEYIECNGARITTVNNDYWYFTISAKPSTVTTTKYCSNLGQNLKTSSCYYKTCEIKTNGNWDWSAIKQSQSFCDVAETPTDYTTEPLSPACVSDWKTSDWSECINSVKTRQVWDNTGCSSATGTKPATQDNCVNIPTFEEIIVQPPVNNGTDSQIDPLQYCKDKGFTGYDAPTNTCTKAGAGNGSDDFVSKYKYYIAGAIVLLFAWASGLMVYLSKK